MYCCVCLAVCCCLVIVLSGGCCYADLGCVVWVGCLGCLCLVVLVVVVGGCLLLERLFEFAGGAVRVLFWVSDFVLIVCFLVCLISDLTCW